MVKILNLFVAASAVMLLASCSSPRQLPVPALTGAMKERAKGFRSALAADAVRGVTLSEDDLLFFLDRPELLFERLELLGVNRIYVTADSVRILRGDRGD